MSRTDLQEHEISALERKARRVLADPGHRATAPDHVWTVTKGEADQLLRLTGEVLELRNREAHVRQIQGLEGDEY